jgi:hypothetical protein
MTTLEGKKAPAFSLPGSDGRTHAPAARNAAGHPAGVLAWLRNAAADREGSAP